MQPAVEPPAIEFRDVSFRVAGTQVLSGFNLQVQGGETIVLLGRSGSGKTTSLKLVNRLLTPTSGSFRISPLNATSVSSRKLKAGPRTGFVVARGSCCRWSGLRQR